MGEHSIRGTLSIENLLIAFDTTLALPGWHKTIIS